MGYEEAEKFMRDRRFNLFFETSAKYGEMVTEVVFTKISKHSSKKYNILGFHWGDEVDIFESHQGVPKEATYAGVHI